VLARLTVKDNLDLGAYVRKDGPAIKRDLERMYALWPRLKERSGQLAGTLSGGEQQMLAMARALMSRPELLLLDEPSLGLAPIIVQEIFQIIAELNAEGATILLVEQNAHLAMRTAHRAYVLEAGRIVAHGDAKELAGDERGKKADLGEGAQLRPRVSPEKKACKHQERVGQKPACVDKHPLFLQTGIRLRN
jgi:branched-chain amino acid transport system ATP-binding protein